MFLNLVYSSLGHDEVMKMLNVEDLGSALSHQRLLNVGSCDSAQSSTVEVGQSQHPVNAKTCKVTVAMLHQACLPRD